jgi:hypothetical protein
MSAFNFISIAHELRKKIGLNWHQDGYAVPRLWDGPHTFVRPVASTILRQIYGKNFHCWFNKLI